MGAKEIALPDEIFSGEVQRGWHKPLPARTKAVVKAELAAAQALVQKLQAEYNGILETERLEALAKIHNLMLAWDIKPEEIKIPHASRERKKRVGKLYRHGDLQWSGLGPYPQWMRAMLSQGRKKSEFLVLQQ